ncbi:MAG TPA: 1,2-phenylacetyl-CoA epoxidase subunit PaaC [Actinomycetota bacterium]|nr:1,2-phenylacetyl-CoA epoxidase subunit PaaC [Actinomycetota bacterium]
MSKALVSLLTALGDDELVLGHRHSEWTGCAPHMEEDVAFSSIAQDEIGHAAAYYSIAAAATGESPDALAFGRDPGEYRHAIVCERPNGDWAFTLARHWLYDNADDVRLAALESASHPELAALARKIRREERYHLIHADTWIKRIVRGPVEGRTKLIDAVSEVYVQALGLFEPVEEEAAAVAEGLLPVPSGEMLARFVERTGNALDELGLPTESHKSAGDTARFEASSSGDLIADDRGEVELSSTTPGVAMGGRAGRHTDDFKELWDVMTVTYRSHPGASW